MRVYIWMGVALLTATGCKKDGVPDAAGEGVQTGSGTGFVPIEITIDEEEDPDLIAIEIQRATAECGDLLNLEPSAMMGLLNDAQILCLDSSLRVAERQTVKDKISRVLLVDAWQKGDRHRWEGVARRHLEVIDRSDADLAYQFAYTPGAIWQPRHDG